VHLLRLLPPLLLLLAAGGCATLDGPPDPRDPLERFNRSMYQFNDTLDRAVLKPVAKAYDTHLPKPVNTGISNFFSNLGDVGVFINDLLQLKLKHAASDLARLAFNTTAGLGGLIDVATHLDLPKRDEDFGQTLGYWGVPRGPYLVLPFIGPSTVRDGPALVVDWELDPVDHLGDREIRYGAVALRTIDKRAGLLQSERLMDQAAFDRYSFLRDAWLQQRRSKIHDGNPPPEFEFDFDFEEPPQ